MKKWLLYSVLCTGLLTACNNNSGSNNEAVVTNAVPPPAIMNYSVLKIYPHDSTSYTEGLLWLNNSLYESAGQYKESRIQRTDLATGKILQKTPIMGAQYFGEGISVLNNKIYQLTYQSHNVFVYDMNFKKLPQEFSWPYEGWGMTTDGKSLILNTGGSTLYFVDPETFKVEKTLAVIDNNGYVDSINELEYLDGYVYANRYTTNYILKINLKTGYVEGKADLTGIFEKNGVKPADKQEVLNGIAYDSTKKSFYITGKYWPAIFEVRFN